MSVQRRTIDRVFTRRRALQGAGAGIVGLAAAGIAGCGDDNKDSSASPDAASPSAAATATNIPTGGTLALALNEGTSMNPFRGASGFDVYFLWMIHDNLIQYDKKGIPNAKYSLAESWEQPTALKLVTKLRSGVKFHDGETLTAELMKYNLDLARAGDGPASPSGALVNVESVEAPDAQTLILNLRLPDAALLTALGGRAGMAVSRKTYEQLGPERYQTEPRGGSGPFVFESWTKNDSFKVTRFKDHWRKSDSGQQLPYLDGLTGRFLTESAVRTAAFESNELQGTSVSPVDLERFKSSGAQIEQFLGLSVAWGSVNATEGAILRDPRVRKAIALAVDREAINSVQTDGLGKVALGPITPAQWAYNPDLDAPKFNLAEAKRLISAAGVREGTVIRGVTIPGDTNRRNMELWQQMLAQIGFKFQADLLEPAARNQKWKEGAYDLSFTAGPFSIDPHSAIYTSYHSKGTAFDLSPSDAECDRLVEEANTKLDINERKPLYDRIQVIVARDVIMKVFTYYTASVYALKPNILNAEGFFWGDGFHRYAELAVKKRA